MNAPRRVAWTQALCEPCFASFQLGQGNLPREPTRLKGAVEEVGDPCLVCGTQTAIFVRIDPALTSHFQHAKLRDD